MRYRNTVTRRVTHNQKNPDISHLRHAKPWESVVVYYRDGEWHAGMPMSPKDAEALASDYRTLRNTPAMVHNAQQLLRMGLPEGPPRKGTTAYIGNPSAVYGAFRANPHIPDVVQRSTYGFPVAGKNVRITAADLYPLASPTDKARIERLCREKSSYSGEYGDVLSGIWARLGWPIPERKNPKRKNPSAVYGAFRVYNPRRCRNPHPQEGDTVNSPLGRVTLRSPPPGTDYEEMTNGQLEYTRLALIHELSAIAKQEESKTYRDQKYDPVAADYRRLRAEMERRKKS